MKSNKIPDAAKVRLVIDGVALQSTAKLMRTGSLSMCLWNAFRDFEAEYATRRITGRMAQYEDSHLGRLVNIQIDLY